MREAFRTGVAAGIVGLVASIATAHASSLTGTFSFSVQTDNTTGGFNADPNTTAVAASAAATFTYTGALNFSNAAAQNSGSTGDLDGTFFASAGNAGPNYGISNYQVDINQPITLGPPANVNFTNLTTFLASSGSASNYQYGSLFQINLGILAAGTVLSITHDDGVSVFENILNNRIGSTTSAPTAAITETVVVPTTGDVALFYAHENGTPSILEVNVPEPASLALLGVLRRRSKQG